MEKAKVAFKRNAKICTWALRHIILIGLVVIEDLNLEVHVPAPSLCKWLCAVRKVPAGVYYSRLCSRGRNEVEICWCVTQPDWSPFSREQLVVSRPARLWTALFPPAVPSHSGQMAKPYPSVPQAVVRVSSLSSSFHCPHMKMKSLFWNSASVLSELCWRTYHRFVVCIPDFPFYVVRYFMIVVAFYSYFFFLQYFMFVDQQCAEWSKDFNLKFKYVLPIDI